MDLNHHHNIEGEGMETGEKGTAMEFTPAEVGAQVQNIQHLKDMVLIDKEHYGKIPGCGDKPALLKAGAEKLAFMFRLAPKFTITKTELPGGHREYEITCEFTHGPTGKYVGAGLGVCSTMESKYRYRADKSADIVTEIQVPKTYWDRKKAGADGVELQRLLSIAAGEAGRFGTKKDANEVWVIVKRGESTGDKVENPDLADTYNTVIKMAKKRAYVDAVITCTAASDFFTQDIEEFAPDVQEVKPEVKQEAVLGDVELTKVTKNCADIMDTAELSVYKDECKKHAGWYWTEKTKAVFAARYNELTQQKQG